MMLLLSGIRRASTLAQFDSTLSLKGQKTNMTAEKSKREEGFRALPSASHHTLTGDLWQTLQGWTLFLKDKSDAFGREDKTQGFLCGCLTSCCQKHILHTNPDPLGSLVCTVLMSFCCSANPHSNMEWVTSVKKQTTEGEPLQRFSVWAAFPRIAQSEIPPVRPPLHKDLAALCLTDNYS